MLINHLGREGGCSKRQCYWMKNKEQYSHVRFPLSCPDTVQKKKRKCSSENQKNKTKQKQYSCTLFFSRRFRIGPLLNVHYPGSSFLEAASRLNPNGLNGWGGGVPWVEGDMSLIHIIPHGPGRQSSTVHQLLLNGTLDTTAAHLTDLSGLLTPNIFPVGHKSK